MRVVHSTSLAASLDWAELGFGCSMLSAYRAATQLSIASQAPIVMILLCNAASGYEGAVACTLELSRHQGLVEVLHWRELYLG